jgi:elongation of very long chain fatty acids protein 6
MENLLDVYEETLSSFCPMLFDFVDNHPHSAPITCVGLYLLMVFFLPKLLRTKDGKPKPVGPILKYSIVLWNLFLSVFSGALCLISVIPFSMIVWERGPISTICDTEGDLFLPSSKIFGGLVFVYSKYAELLDTLFLILKNPNRKIPFLHWYHHSTVLLFSWYATMNRLALGYWFGSINACVHMLMYFYYFLTELGYKPTWAKVLTIFQISQMVIGIVLNVLFAMEWYSGRDCNCHNSLSLAESYTLRF